MNPRIAFALAVSLILSVGTAQASPNGPGYSQGVPFSSSQRYDRGPVQHQRGGVSGQLSSQREADRHYRGGNYRHNDYRHNDYRRDDYRGNDHRGRAPYYSDRRHYDNRTFSYSSGYYTDRNHYRPNYRHSSRHYVQPYRVYGSSRPGWRPDTRWYSYYVSPQRAAQIVYDGHGRRIVIYSGYAYWPSGRVTVFLDHDFDPYYYDYEIAYVW